MNINPKLYKDIDLRKEKVFYTQRNSKISINYISEFKSNLNENEKEYIGIFEDNLGFGQVGQYPIEINFDNIYTIEFMGSSKNLQVELFIITYSKDKKLVVESVALNRTICIYPHKEAKSIRLAVRVLGSGEFKIDSLKIYINKKIDFMSYKDINIMELDKPNNIKDLRVAAIFDEFTMNCYKDMIDIIELTPNKWKLELSIKKPHILLVESAWQGNAGLWNKKIASRDEYNLRLLNELTSWCRENNIPTVFWNKEDPVHFDAFILACKYFDYIFTTDEGMINKYKQILKHDNIYVLPFAAQPKIHNPIKMYSNKINKACFAGTYYAGKFEEREHDINTVLRASINTIGLDIYDRQYFNQGTLYKFPNEYITNIKGGLNADELDITNKGYKITLNVNSVKHSNTMFSRRVFESVASLTPVISSYSPGIKNIFSDLVTSSDDIDELEREINNLQDDSYYDKKSIQGMRFCMQYHTYNHRLSYILEKIGMEFIYKDSEVSLIAVINKTLDIESTLNIFENQSYENKQLLLIYLDEQLYQNMMNYNHLNIKHILYEDYIVINDITKSNYIGVINTNNYYGKYYIQDLINATKYAQAEFIGKKSYFKSKKQNIFTMGTDNLLVENEDISFEYVDSIDLDKCIVDMDVVCRYNLKQFIHFIEINNIDKFKFGCRYFSIDKYNLVENLYHISENQRKAIEI